MKSVVLEPFESNSPYDKEDHLEFSDGDTAFIAVKNCPLTDEEIEIEPRVISNNNVVCCRNSDKDFNCPHFYKLLMVELGAIRIQCSKMELVNRETGSPNYRLLGTEIKRAR